MSESEMKNISSIFTGCSQEAAKIALAIYTIQTELNPKIYEGTAASKVIASTNYLALGMYRMSLLYEQLSIFIDEAMESFKSIDEQEGEQAENNVVTQKTRG